MKEKSINKKNLYRFLGSHQKIEYCKVTQRKNFGLTVCVYSMCVWPLGLNTSDTHEMTRAKGAENFSEHVHMHG